LFRLGYDLRLLVRMESSSAGSRGRASVLDLVPSDPATVGWHFLQRSVVAPGAAGTSLVEADLGYASGFCLLAPWLLGMDRRCGHLRLSLCGSLSDAVASKR